MYDRQLRLWGSAGQKRLANSSIVLVGNSSSAGIEAVKNLILPGVGSVVIVGDEECELARVNDDDAMNDVDENTVPMTNFFLPLNGSSNSSSSSEISKNLQSLNTDCSVKTADETVEKFVNGGCVERYCGSRGGVGGALVISNDLSVSLNDKLSQSCCAGNLPLIILRTYGLVGTCRIQSPTGSFAVIDPGEGGAGKLHDVRIYDVWMAQGYWPEMTSYLSSESERLKALLFRGDLKDEPTLEAELSHIPYIVILYAALVLYEQRTGRKEVTAFSHKQAYKAALSELCESSNATGVNFDEAKANAHQGYAVTSRLTETVSALVTSLTPASSGSSELDLMLHALVKHLEVTSGMTPLNGSIPDMVSTSENYIALQTLYSDRSSADLEGYKRSLRSVEELAGRSGRIEDDTVRTFVKNLPNVSSVTSKPYHLEISPASHPPASSVKELLRDALVEDCACQPYPPSLTPALWWIGVRACEAYHSQTGSWPGATYEDDGSVADARKVYDIMLGILETYGLKAETISQPPPVPDAASINEAQTCLDSNLLASVSSELCRYSNSEVHNISAVIGGVAAQEATKIITRKYAPIDNTYVFNGIAGVAGVCSG